MLYEYKCKEHGVFSVWKPAAEAPNPEICPTCQVQADRVWQVGGFSGEKVEHAAWDPGLGCVVKNSAHRAQIAKSRGLVEIGNEKPETIAREMAAAQKTAEQKREQRYNEAMNEVFG